LNGNNKYETEKKEYIEGYLKEKKDKIKEIKA